MFIFACINAVNKPREVAFTTMTVAAGWHSYILEDELLRGVIVRLSAALKGLV
jgi:hypothetical protein